MANKFVITAIMFIATGSTFADKLAPEQEEFIDQAIEEKWQEFLGSEEFDKRVEESIIQYIQKQNQARGDQQKNQAQLATKNISKVDPISDYILGDPNAAFSLIEYSDYECPFCKRFHKTAKAFIDKNPQVNWVYRHFPLDFHNPGAQKQAEAAECVGALKGNDAFWNYSDAIYERTKSNGKGFPIENLAPLALELGLNKDEFENCFNNETYRDKVLAQITNGQASGVTGTPGNFLVNHESGEITVITGALPLSALEQALEKLK